MAHLMTIQSEDNRRIEALKARVGAKSKVEILRRALDELEKKVEQERRLERWKKAAALVGTDSALVNREFQSHSRLKRS